MVFLLVFFLTTTNAVRGGTLTTDFFGPVSQFIAPLHSKREKKRIEHAHNILCSNKTY